MPKKPSSDLTEALEGHLRALLEEVQMVNGMGKSSTEFCLGCYKSRRAMPFRACVQARSFLAELDKQKLAS